MIRKLGLKVEASELEIVNEIAYYEGDMAKKWIQGAIQTSRPLTAAAKKHGVSSCRKPRRNRIIQPKIRGQRQSRQKVYQGVDLNGLQRELQFVYEQVRQDRNDDDAVLEISCPYCLSTSVPGTEFCCKTSTMRCSNYGQAGSP